MKPLVVAVAQSGPGFERAKQLFDGRDDIAVLAPRAGFAGAVRTARAVTRAQPRLVYVVDIGLGTTTAALAARLRGARLVVDTGDLVFELERSRGERSAAGLAAVWAGERFTLASADHVVVRGTAHGAYIPAKISTYAPDVAPQNAGPRDGGRIRRDLGLESCFVVGIVGSLNRAPRLGICYGWDLIEALPRTPPNVTALIVGDGPAKRELEELATRLQVLPRCRFVGAVSPTEAPQWIAAMDAAVSTQTHDAVGVVRTTGKLPLYLACGCPVLASDVGEAQRLLGSLGWTIPYDGVVDHAYPARLAQAITRWAGDPQGEQARRGEALRLAREAFDTTVVRSRVLDVIDRLLATSGTT